jgi:exportin-2 (importin alpha re-exporter)
MGQNLIYLPARWRSQIRSDSLYTEINYVLSRFCEPYTGLFVHVDKLLSEPSSSNQNQNSKSSLPILAETVQLLLELFHDLSSQDLPPFFEDNIGVFMGNAGTGEQGLLLKYLTWEPEQLKGDVGVSRFCRG